jgi:uncharacterized protein
MMLKYIGCIFFVIAYIISVSAKEIPELTNPVIDQAGILSEQFKFHLNNKLKEEYTKTGKQIEIVIISSLEGDPIETYSIKLFDKWKLGNKKEDKGVLVLISINDHKSRIEVGRGLEGTLTDLASHRILKNANPFLKNKDYESGINLIVSQIINKGLDNQEKKGSHLNSNKNNINIISIIIILLVILVSVSVILYFLGFDGFLFIRFILEIFLAIISSGRGGWSGGGGGSAGGGSSSDWD